jgi:hypothetical protein
MAFFVCGEFSPVVGKELPRFFDARMQAKLLPLYMYSFLAQGQEADRRQHLDQKL